MAEVDPDEQSRRLAADSLRTGDATGWFERLYVAAEEGRTAVPWDRGAPHALLVDWAERQPRGGAGGRALVVGSGLGDDAEFVAGLGYETVAFDVAATAVASARERHPRSAVRYEVADLLDPPADWHRAFDLVVESLTVQSLPLALRERAIAGVTGFVAPGGTLLVIAAAHEGGGERHGPPWPLTREEVESFARDGLALVRLEALPASGGGLRWRAELERPGGTAIDALLGHAESYAARFDAGGIAAAPARRVAVVTCMDARIDVFALFGLRPGDAHVLRNAGGVVTDDVIRSLAISQRELGTEEVLLVHHTGCGMLTISDDGFRDAVEADTGVRPPWATEAFADLDEDVRRSIARVRDSPFLPHRDRVRGFVYDVETGRLREVR